MKNNKIEINTPLGIITVETKLDGYYPGIYINLEGDNVKGVFLDNCIPLAVVEFDPNKEKIQTIVYKKAEDEEPSYIIEHDINGRVENE